MEFAVLVVFRCVLVQIKHVCRGDHPALAEHNMFYQRMPTADPLWLKARRYGDEPEQAPSHFDTQAS